MLLLRLLFSKTVARVIGEANVFDIQEKVLDDILRSVQEQGAMEAAPKILDPVQQTVITLLRGYLSSPLVKRQEVKDAIRKLSEPMRHTEVKRLRKALDAFQSEKDILALLEIVLSIGKKTENNNPIMRPTEPLNREDLHLVCFDYVCS